MKPIIFSTPMVRAILEGRKTQTRRVIKPQPEYGVNRCHYTPGGWAEMSKPNEFGVMGCHCGLKTTPIADVGDVFWVREVHAHSDRSMWNGSILYQSGHMWTAYKADGSLYLEGNLVGALDNVEQYPSGKEIIWHSPIHMPRAAARIFLRVTDVRVERVQEISEADAKAEGVRSYWITKEAGKNTDDWHESNSPPFIGTAKEIGADLCSTRREAYQQLWDSLNAKRGYGWETNPFVWVYTFERVNEDGTPCAP